jgi:hypothetical protein
MIGYLLWVGWERSASQVGGWTSMQKNEGKPGGGIVTMSIDIPSMDGAPDFRSAIRRTAQDLAAYERRATVKLLYDVYLFEDVQRRDPIVTVRNCSTCGQWCARADGLCREHGYPTEPTHICDEWRRA